MQTTLIAADNTLLLWAFLMLAAAAAIVIEQNVRWAAKIPGAVIALLIALAASNFGLVPADAPVYDAVWGYVVPLAVPLLLFQLDLHAVFKESGRLLLLFLISSAGTMAGAVAGFLMLRDYIPELDKITGMIAASYTGGGVNFAAMAAKLQPSDSMKAATIVADNLMMACYFVILIAVSSSKLVRRIWRSGNENTGSSGAAAYWRPKEISLQNIAVSLGLSVLLVALSFTLSGWLKAQLGEAGNIFTDMLFGLITDKYLLLTTLTFIAILLVPRRRRNVLNGSQELGTYAIYLFFVVIGIPASIPLIMQQAPLLFVFTLTVAVVNLVITMAAGKLLRYTIEEITLACNANIGGQGWRSLVGAILVIGTVGYIIGNYIGSLVYALVSTM